MAPVDPLQLAASHYTAAHWDDDDWRQFGRETGTADIINAHPRLYRSLSFGDPDYPDAAMSVLGDILTEAPEPKDHEAGRMAALSDSMPELRIWITESAPPRVKRMFESYLAERDSSEIPTVWREGFEGDGERVGPLRSRDPTEAVDPVKASTPPTTGASQAFTQPIVPPTQSVEATPSGVRDITSAQPTGEIFIVHGHDEASMNSIRVFVHRVTGLMPVSLAEEPAQGRTIIEKFEDFGGAAEYVIVLLTADDMGQTLEGHILNEEPSPRARQNVVMELGYFIGKLGRRKIVVMDGGVERPSDIAGVNYISYPGENWQEQLRTELEAAGLKR